MRHQLKMGTSSFLSIAAVLSLVSAAAAVSPLHRAPRDATKTGNYIVVLHDNVTDAAFNWTLERALSLSQDKRPHVVIRLIEKAFSLFLNSYSLHSILSWQEVKRIEEETEAVGDQDQSIRWHLDLLDSLQTTPIIDYQYRPVGTGRGVDAYVLDTGINYDHEEFERRAKYSGYDPMDQYYRNPFAFRYGRDCNGHGTHVASLLGGKTFGSAKGVSIFSTRVLNCQSRAPWSVVIDGMDQVLRMILERRRPSIVNLSLGGAYQQSVSDAVRRLVNAGAVVVVSAGNGARDACFNSPASSPHAITVGGTNSTNYLYGNTNYGRCVDIFAPAVFVEGAHYRCDQQSIGYPSSVRNNSCSFLLTGTSMASPIVGGVVAVMLGRQPALRPSEVRALLRERAVRNAIKDIRPDSPDLFVNTMGSCGGYYPIRTSFNLSSPNYPSPYPHGLVCEWQIPVNYNEDVAVTLLDIDLENGFDYLFICEENNECLNFTGRHGNGTHYRTSNGNLIIRLITDNSKNGRGFKMNFTKYYVGTPFSVPDTGKLLPPVSTSLLPLATTRTYLKVDSTHIKSLVTQQKGEGFDVLSISVTQAPPPDHRWYYAVVFHNSTQTPSVGFVELRSIELNVTLDQMFDRGFIPFTITARLNGTTPLYSVVFRREPPFIESHAHWDVGVPAHVMSRVNMERRGWHLTSQHFLVGRGNRTTASAVFRRDLRRVYNVPLMELVPDRGSYYGFHFSRFSSLTLEFLHQDYHLKHASTYHHGNETSTRFSAVYETKVAGQRSYYYWIRWGQNSSKVVEEINQFSNHWDIVYIVNYVYNSELLYIVQWGRKIGY